MPRFTETITVAAAQLSARLMNEAPATLESIHTAIERAAAKRVDLLVLPECAYPAYLLGSITSYRDGDHLDSAAFLDWLRAQAARHRLHIVCGLVEDTGSSLYNTGVLVDDQGREIGRTRKRFLWHMDHEWFARGDKAQVFDTALGRIGVVICAEARDPELVATLVSGGAELIAMPTCWINSASQSGQFYNPQVDFLIEARTREFGVPWACADKCGIELGTVGYVGQSRIVRGDGTLAAEAPHVGETVVAARLVLRPPPRLWINTARRKRLLGRDKAIRPPHLSSRMLNVAVMPTAVANARFTGGMGQLLFEPLRQRGVQLLMANLNHEGPAEQLRMLGHAYDIQAFGFPSRADAFSAGEVRIGCLAGQWARSFAAARDLALDGAELLMLFDMPDDPAMLRARALENRVFVLGANSQSAMIIGPDGEVLAHTTSNPPGEAVARIELARAADKLVAPQTDIFDERSPSLYQF